MLGQSPDPPLIYVRMHVPTHVCMYAGFKITLTNTSLIRGKQTASPLNPGALHHFTDVQRMKDLNLP